MREAEQMHRMEKQFRRRLKALISTAIECRGLWETL